MRNLSHVLQIWESAVSEINSIQKHTIQEQWEAWQLCCLSSSFMASWKTLLEWWEWPAEQEVSSLGEISIFGICVNTDLPVSVFYCTTLSRAEPASWHLGCRFWVKSTLERQKKPSLMWIWEGCCCSLFLWACHCDPAHNWVLKVLTSSLFKISFVELEWTDGRWGLFWLQTPAAGLLCVAILLPPSAVSLHPPLVNFVQIGQLHFSHHI